MCVCVVLVALKTDRTGYGPPPYSEVEAAAIRNGDMREAIKSTTQKRRYEKKSPSRHPGPPPSSSAPENIINSVNRRNCKLPPRNINLDIVRGMRAVIARGTIPLFNFEINFFVFNFAFFFFFYQTETFWSRARFFARLL